MIKGVQEHPCTETGTFSRTGGGALPVSHTQQAVSPIAACDFVDLFLGLEQEQTALQSLKPKVLSKRGPPAPVTL